MKARLAASAILVALLAAGTTGCTFMTPQVTTIAYDPSDGIRATLGDIKVNNALLVTEDGENASLVVSLQNTSDFGVQVNVQYEDASKSKVNDSVHVNARSVASLGASGAHGTSTIVLTGIDAPAGTLFPIFLQYDDVTGQQLWVPVLAAEGPYADLAPAPTE